MRGLVDDEDGNVLRDGVQLFLGRVAQLLQLRVVVAEADDELRLLDSGGVLLGPVAQRLLQRGDVLDLAVGRGQQVGGQRLQAADDDMAVGVDKARNEGSALQIHELGGRALQLHDFAAAAHGKDLAARHGHRLGAHGLVVHGEDGPSRPDAVGGLGRCRCDQRHAGRQCDGECGLEALRSYVHRLSLGPGVAAASRAWPEGRRQL